MAGKAQKRNIGGGTWYAGGNSNVAKEAKERKEGGPVTAEKKKKGGAGKRAYGGRSVGKPEGKLAAGGRLDKRARGGAIRKLATGGGADQRPFSSAGSSHDHSATKTSAVGHAKGGVVREKK